MVRANDRRWKWAKEEKKTNSESGQKKSHRGRKEEKINKSEIEHKAVQLSTLLLWSNVHFLKHIHQIITI